jgi:ornithine carbamoyltransferase
MRNLCVLAGGVLLVLGVTGCSQDSNSNKSKSKQESPVSQDLSKQEAAMSDSVKVLSEYADAIESVKDKQTGIEAAVKINSCCDKMEELAATTLKLPKVNNTTDFDKFLETKVMPEMAKTLKRATKEKVANAVVLCGGEESFKKAMERWGPALNKLQSAQMQMAGGKR